MHLIFSFRSIVDRRTSKQAKFYESESVQFWEYLLFSHFLEFENCAALTQFSNGLYGPGIPVPATSAAILCGYSNDDSCGDPNNRSVDVRFLHLYYNGTTSAVETLD